MNLSPRARALLAAQKDRYLESLPDRRVAFEQMWKRVIKDASNRDLLRELTRASHQLAGNAGNFGLDELGQAARALDKRLQVCQTEDADPVAGCQPAMNGLIGAFDKAIEAL